MKKFINREWVCKLYSMSALLILGQKWDGHCIDLSAVNTDINGVRCIDCGKEL